MIIVPVKEGENIDRAISVHYFFMLFTIFMVSQSLKRLHDEIYVAQLGVAVG